MLKNPFTHLTSQPPPGSCRDLLHQQEGARFPCSTKMAYLDRTSCNVNGGQLYASSRALVEAVLRRQPAFEQLQGDGATRFDVKRNCHVTLKLDQFIADEVISKGGYQACSLPPTYVSHCWVANGRPIVAPAQRVTYTPPPLPPPPSPPPPALLLLQNHLSCEQVPCKLRRKLFEKGRRYEAGQR